MATASNAIPSISGDVNSLGSGPKKDNGICYIDMTFAQAIKTLTRSASNKEKGRKMIG